MGVYLPCCVCQFCRGALLHGKEHQWEYIYPVVYVNTAEDLFYKTRSTSRSISTLLCQYCRGALLQDKEHKWVYIYPVVCFNTAEELFYKEHLWEYTYPVVCVNTAEELFYKTRSTSGSISTLLCVSVLQRSSSTREGAPVGVYLPCCVC